MLVHQMGYLHQSDLVSDFKSQKSHLFTTSSCFRFQNLSHWRTRKNTEDLEPHKHHCSQSWSDHCRKCTQHLNRSESLNALQNDAIDSPLIFCSFFQPPWRQEWQLLSCQLKIWFYMILWYIWRILRSEGHFSTSYIQGVKGCLEILKMALIGSQVPKPEQLMVGLQ